MAKKIMLFFSLIFFSQVVSAGIIEFNGYSRDENSKVVVGGGLQWLKWDQTTGLSINQALDKYSKRGWELASFSQVQSLFNSFRFGKADWNDTRYSWQSHYTLWVDSQLYAQDAFLMLFGVTSNTDNRQNSIAFHGGINDAATNVGRSYIHGKYQPVVRGKPSGDPYLYAEIEHKSPWNRDDSWWGLGIALVKTTTPNNQVPLPSPIAIISLGYLVLIYRSRKLKQRIG